MCAPLLPGAAMREQGGAFCLSAAPYATRDGAVFLAEGGSLPISVEASVTPGEGVRFSRAWVSRCRRRAPVASGADERRCTDRLGVCAIAVATTNPPESAPDTRAVMVNASNIMVESRGFDDSQTTILAAPNIVTRCFTLYPRPPLRGLPRPHKQKTHRHRRRGFSRRVHHPSSCMYG